MPRNWSDRDEYALQNGCTCPVCVDRRNFLATAANERALLETSGPAYDIPPAPVTPARSYSTEELNRRLNTPLS